MAYFSSKPGCHKKERTCRQAGSHRDDCQQKAAIQPKAPASRRQKSAGCIPYIITIENTKPQFQQGKCQKQKPDPPVQLNSRFLIRIKLKIPLFCFFSENKPKPPGAYIFCPSGFHKINVFFFDPTMHAKCPRKAWHIEIGRASCRERVFIRV